MKLSQKGRINGLLLLLFMVSAITMIYFGCPKEGYHVDEVYSYGLANSEYLPFMHFGSHDYNVKEWMMEYGAGESFWDLFKNLKKDIAILRDCGFEWHNSVIYQDYLRAQANSADTRSSSWVSGQAYKNYIAVSETNRFNYASVYYNQRGDVHPPLYYMILHTVCSVFQGVFSKWFGLGINMVILLLALFVLYRMTQIHLGGSAAALAALAIYAMSCGLMTTALYIRMYALMTLMVLCCCMVHLKIFSEDFRFCSKNLLLLASSVVGGYMTHYYFVIYALGVAAVFSVVMILRRKWKALLKYFLCLTASAAFGLCIWPFAIKHVFSGYRGNEAMNILLAGEYYQIKTTLMIRSIADQMLGGHGWILLLVAVLVVAVSIWKRDKKIFSAKDAIVFLPPIIYVLFVSQIVPFYAERYVMCVFPFVCLFMVRSVSFCARRCLERRKYNLAITLTSCILILFNNAYFHTPSYLYTGGQQTVILPMNTDCIYVLPDGDWNESAVDSTILAQCKRVAVTYVSDLPSLVEGYSRNEGDSLLVAIQKDMDVEAVLSHVRELFGVEELQEVERQEGSTAFRILLQDETE